MLIGRRKSCNFRIHCLFLDQCGTVLSRKFKNRISCIQKLKMYLNMQQVFESFSLCGVELLTTWHLQQRGKFHKTITLKSCITRCGGFVHRNSDGPTNACGWRLKTSHITLSPGKTEVHYVKPSPVWPQELFE